MATRLSGRSQPLEALAVLNLAFWFGWAVLALVRGMHTDTPTDAVPPAQRNGTKFTLSRGYREKLQDRLGRPL